MFEDIISHINSLNPVWIYVILFFFSFIENIFPPSPSDVVVIVGSAVLAQLSYVHFIPILIVTGLGSSTGFMFMYFIGKLFGEKIIRTRKFKFITPESISKTDKWFARYGYKLIFTGFSKLLFGRSFVLATVSALIWNCIIIYLGFLLGYNVKLIDEYLTTYRDIVLIITILIIAVFLIRYFISKSKGNKN
jgi:membrane protein DedA with SNARE-associated domain